MLILLFQLKKENQQVRKAYFGSNRKENWMMNALVYKGISNVTKTENVLMVQYLAPLTVFVSS